MEMDQSAYYSYNQQIYSSEHFCSYERKKRN